MRTVADTGHGGENHAEAYLIRAGYQILDRNFRIRQGEIDLIAQSQDGYLAFVEVKTRRSDMFAAAREYVTLSKQQRIIIAASAWLAEHPSALQPRFDVIEIYWPRNTLTPTSIEHIPNAFET